MRKFIQAPCVAFIAALLYVTSSAQDRTILLTKQQVELEAYAKANPDKKMAAWQDRLKTISARRPAVATASSSETQAAIPIDLHLCTGDGQPCSPRDENFSAPDLSPL